MTVMTKVKALTGAAGFALTLMVGGATYAWRCLTGRRPA
jgi:hypothetical protein